MTRRKPAQANRENPESIFIDSMELGGKPLKAYRIAHSDLMDGKSLKFNLSDSHK